MANKDYIAAEAAKLYIGDIEFDAIRVIKTGEYRMAQTQVLEPINLPKNWILRLHSDRPNLLQALLNLGFSGYTLSVKINTGKVRSAKTLSLEDVTIFWEYQAFEHNNKDARVLLRALTQDSLRDRFSQVFNKPRATVEERRQSDNRILEKACAYDALYKKETCEKGFGWYGTHFYWRYFYFWMSLEEKATHERVNPVKNGRRQYYIHQMIEQETRERLRDKAIELGTLIKMSRSRDDFENNFRKVYGAGWQLDLFNS